MSETATASRPATPHAAAATAPAFTLWFTGLSGAGKTTIAEIVGANLVAGAVIVALGLMGVGSRIMAWLPLPIVMAQLLAEKLTEVRKDGTLP